MEDINKDEQIKADEAAAKEAEAAEEAELDKVLEESIESVKAGNELAPVKEEAKAEEPKEETPEEEKPEDTSTPPPDEVKTEEVKPEEVKPEEAKPEEAYEFRVPNKGKFESDESYEKRIELLDLVKRRKLAKTDEQRQELSADIKTAKGQLKNLNGTDRFINPLSKVSEEVNTTPEEDDDETLAADKERLRQLGGATKEDIEEIVRKERLATDVKNTLDKFVERHNELKDDDTREVFFDFVDSNYNWQNKGGKELMTVLELARESMFKPSESVQERVLKAANVQEKVNAMQFPGGTVAKTEFSPEMRKDLDELIATGLSEEKAIELLSD
jgi:hypothetical protein